jgi:hypothetical protein
MPARKTPLRAVAPGEKPAPPAAPKTVTQAARDGSPRELMVAMRDRIAVAVENPNTPARDLAALTKRLAETVREIEAIDARRAEEARESVASPDEAWDAEAL